MSESEVNTFYEINGYKVYFVKYGSGPEPILLIPGAIGTGKSDFPELLDSEDELDFHKFSVIAVEAPGWGRSRPPLRKYGINVYNNDCECFHGVMKHLGYEKYSIIGFSEGARVALLMAIKYQSSITSMVLSAIKNSTSSKELSSLFATKSVDNWSEQRIKDYLKVYGSKDEIQKLWNRLMKFFEFYNQYFPEDIYKNNYHLVKCPVLITHGDKDLLIEVEQPIDICKRLPNARLHRFPLGDHESHRKYATQYVKLVQDHILNRGEGDTNPSKFNADLKDQLISVLEI